MGGKQASETLLGIKLQQMEKEGKHIGKEEQQKLLADIQARYDHETDPYFAAARLWVDGIIDPLETRSIVSMGIAMATNNSRIPPFNPGVIQT
jgi:acetyl-CoA carboxylase carboxyltransferase component